ncbi:MAG TPA: LysM peptidoglycan-binding domain-containing protein [Chitinophagaceae bacterium]|nr:LysM peptidoglycan-binding domain-containing protein [Chitinophagaceae bacterium]HNU15714.1 LysM peptidoglycan-binding domain-containing protein [Chitinophagaceae bacterium]
MKQFFFSFLALTLFSISVIAQRADLVVKNGDKGLYLEHKVAAKESFFSVGRLYNVHPKHIASYNKLDMVKGLLIDQKLRIPLTDTNFTQKANSGTPVYYKTGSNISLEDISKENNNVTVANLKGWNNLSADNAKKDTKLIIGFLLSKEMPSITIKPKTSEPVARKEEKPVVTEPKVEEKPAEKTEAKPIEKPEEKPVVKVEEKRVVKTEEKTVTGGQGFFKSHFDQQVKKSPVTKDETVTAGIFKTTSGWQDEKYYILIDAVSPGTIVRIVNPANSKAVYAKVLGEMSGIRQNEGYNIRISNAAANVLQITEQDKFIVKVNY